MHKVMEGIYSLYPFDDTLPEREQTKVITTTFEYGDLEFLLYISLGYDKRDNVNTASLAVKPTCAACAQERGIVCHNGTCGEENKHGFYLMNATTACNTLDLTDEGATFTLVSMGAERPLADGLIARGKNPYDSIIMENYLRDYLDTLAFTTLKPYLMAA